MRATRLDLHIEVPTKSDEAGLNRQRARLWDGQSRFPRWAPRRKAEVFGGYLRKTSLWSRRISIVIGTGFAAGRRPHRPALHLSSRTDGGFRQ